MKKTFLVLSSLAFIVACGNNQSKEGSTTESKSQEQTQKTAEDPDVEKGLGLITKSDCLTCHQVEVKTTGPAYVDVAAKYPNNDQVIDSLSQKIIKGGAGNWGTVPMTPHPTLSPEDAKAMVKYVLSLKK